MVALIIPFTLALTGNNLYSGLTQGFNLELISEIAHSMKPSLEQLGSEKIQELNKCFEKKQISKEELETKISAFNIHMNILIEDLRDSSF